MPPHQRNRASLHMHIPGLPDIHANLLLTLLAITVLIFGMSGHSTGEDRAQGAAAQSVGHCVVPALRKCRRRYV